MRFNLHMDAMDLLAIAFVVIVVIWLVTKFMKPRW